jgi:outer membrane receptor protein involved in Fe transport
MNLKGGKFRLCASSIIASTAFVFMASAGVAHAQTTSPPPAPPADDSVAPPTPSPDVVVTGTRVPNPNLTSVSPVSVIGKQDAQLRGTQSVETLLETLPAVSGSYDRGVATVAATGTATVSLRNLGSFRTLVLIDGNRLMPGDPVLPAPDLKTIPTVLVKRVEVVTGGASAVYGSDAVAGVVNFIMDRDLNGLRLDAQFGFAAHNNNNDYAQAMLRAANIAVPDSQIDAKEYSLTAALGVNIADRGNITTYISYSKQDPLTNGRRDFSTCVVGSFQTAAGGPFNNQICQGNPNSALGRFTNFNVSNNPDGSRTFVPYQNSFGYNTNPFMNLIQADERYNAGYFARYSISTSSEIYSDFMYTRDTQISGGPPSGPAFNNGSFAINCANPLMSAAQAAVICGPTAPSVINGISRNLKIGYRIPATTRFKTLNHDDFQIGVGIRGKLGGDWRYDVRFQDGHTTYNQLFLGDVSNIRMNNALNVVNGPNGPTCADPAAVAAGCVPLDIFRANSVGITPAALAYVQVPAFKTGSTSEQIASVNLSGDLGSWGVKSPWAKHPIGLALGFEYRREALVLNSDSEFTTGDLAGGGGVQGSAQGRYNVWDLYGEARVPLVEGKPFVEDLSLELGYRYSKYSLAGPVSAYKASGDWEVSKDFRFRGGYNRAVRAPNLIELFSPAVVSFASFSDPCSGAAGASVAGCARTFATPALAAAQLGSVPACLQAQCNVLQGSPTDRTVLKPERADTITIGAVLTPRMIPGLNITVDYFGISINNPIVQGIGPSLILSQCVTNGVYCSLVHRDPTNGALFGGGLASGYVQNTTTNAGSLKTSGIDFSANYRLGIGGMGALNLSFNGTLTRNFTKQPATGSGSYDCSGLYGLTCGQPLSKWRHQMRVTWATPWSASLSLNWRHLSGVALDLNQSGNVLLATRGATFSDTVDGKLPAYDYFDLSGTVKIAKRFNLRAGITNLFDRNPPIVDGGGNLGLAGFASFGNGNTYTGVYDAIGRSVFVGLSADF